MIRLLVSSTLLLLAVSSRESRLLKPPDPRRRNWVWKSIQAVLGTLFILWFRLRSRGREHLPDGGALLVINHQSFLDPLLVGAPLRRPVSYLARDSLFRVPVIGWILRNTYVMPIRREAAGTESIRKSIERLNQGYYVGIFPEGTRSLDGKLQAIKPGFISLLRRTDVPLIPVGIAGAHRAYPKGAHWIRPYPIHVIYGEPISRETLNRYFDEGRDRELVELVQARMRACLTAAELWHAGRQGTEPDV